MPTPSFPPKNKILELLEKDSNKTDTCWLYHRRVNDSGYGVIRFGSGFRYNNFQYRVHRLSAYIFLGLDIDNDSILALHKCKHKNCWNPDHLYLGNDAQNGLDYRNSRTHCKQGHSLAKYGVLRRRYKDATVMRMKCSECDRIIRKRSAKKLGA